MARVVFLGTPEFAVPILERVYHEHDIAAIITQPDQAAGRGRRSLVVSPVKRWAAAHNLPVFQPARLQRDLGLIEHLRQLKADVFVLAAYGQILRRNVLSLAPGGCVGVHASLLPRWRGAAPIAAAIMNGDTVTGITLMLTDVGMDTGPIIAQREVVVGPDDTTPSLTMKLAHCGAALLAETLPGWLAGRITPLPQDSNQATLAPPLTHEQGELNWSLPAIELERKVRALNPWPGTFSYLSDLPLKILQAHAGAGVKVAGVAGTVVAVGKAIGVVSGEGVLFLEEVQPAGKRSMSAVEYANGRRDFIGSYLGNRAIQVESSS